MQNVHCLQLRYNFRSDEISDLENHEYVKFDKYNQGIAAKDLSNF